MRLMSQHNKLQYMCRLLLSTWLLWSPHLQLVCATTQEAVDPQDKAGVTVKADY